MLVTKTNMKTLISGVNVVFCGKRQKQEISCYMSVYVCVMAVIIPVKAPRGSIPSLQPGLWRLAHIWTSVWTFRSQEGSV